MNEQIKATGNILTVNNTEVKFNRNIRDVKICRDIIVVLLEIPFNETELNNLYGISKQGKIVWRAEDLEKLFPNQNHLPYEQMIVKNNQIIVTDFYARRYFINCTNGNIEKTDVVK